MKKHLIILNILFPKHYRNCFQFILHYTQISHATNIFSKAIGLFIHSTIISEYQPCTCNWYMLFLNHQMILFSCKKFYQISALVYIYVYVCVHAHTQIYVQNFFKFCFKICFSTIMRTNFLCSTCFKMCFLAYD